MISDKPFEEMSLRDEVEADFSFEVSVGIQNVIGSQSEPSFFYANMIRSLIRYERAKSSVGTTKKSGQRRSLVKLQSSARQFVAALDGLPVDIFDAVYTNLQAVTEKERWEGWSFQANEPIPEDDNSLALSRVNTANIVAACQMELDVLDETKGQPKGSSAPALDHLIVELAGLFERRTKFVAASQCYRDQTSEDEYNGKFYNMVKRILDVYAPRSYKTPASLGIRIVRTLHSFDRPNT